MVSVEDLLRVAARIDDHAAALRARAQTLHRATGSTTWESPAATRARHQMHGTIAGIGAAAHRLEHAAAELRGHAAAVRHVQHVLVEAERVGKAIVRDGKVVLTNVESVGRTIGHGAGDVIAFAEHLL